MNDEIHRLMSQGADVFGTATLIEVLCECDLSGCRHLLEVGLGVYEDVRKRRDRWLVFVEHVGDARLVQSDGYFAVADTSADAAVGVAARRGRPQWAERL